MNDARRKEICDRLLAMKVNIESRSIPDPSYINSKIGMCHYFLEEVEHFIIEISQEIATVQQALNNSQSSYDNQKEWMLSNDEEIKQMSSLSIRDREAKVNSKLKKEHEIIKNYQNDLTMLNSVYRATMLKNKNLNLANKAINSQLRIMEAQLKLGTPRADDPAVRGLMEEFKKGLINKDSFEGSVSSISENKVVDPTAPINIEEILKTEELPVNILLTPSEPDEEEPEEFDELGGFPIEDPAEDLLINPDRICEVVTETVIDLDQVIDFKKSEKGGDVSKIIETKRDEVTSVEAEPKAQKETRTIAGIDLDDLLDSIQTN